MAIDGGEAQNVQQYQKEDIPFSDALQKAGFGIFNYCLIFMGGVVIASVLFETASIGFVLPVAECDLQMSNQDKGILSAIGYIGIILSSHLWGFLSDTKGRRAVIMPSLLLAFLSTFISSFSPRFWMLLVARFINGFFISGSSATVYAYVGEFHTDRTRSRAVLAASSIFSIGAMLIPIIAWAVINQSWAIPIGFLGITYKPWRMFVVACGCPGLLGGLALLFFPESPKFLLSIGKESEAIEVLKKMHRWNIGGDELQIKGLIPDKDTEVQDHKKLSSESSDSGSKISKFLKIMWNQTIPVFQKNLLRTTILVCTIQFWMYVTIHGMFMWYPYITESMVDFINLHPEDKSTICKVIYAKQAMNQTTEDGTVQCVESLEDKTYLFSFLMELFFGLGFVVIGSIVQRVQKAHILFVCLVGFGTCGIVGVFVTNTTMAMVLYNMFFLSGLGISVLSGTTLELYPTHLRGMAMCISLMFGRLGGVAGANIAGLLLSDNCEMTFYISGTGLIVCGISTFFLPKIKQCTKAESIAS